LGVGGGGKAALRVHDGPVPAALSRLKTTATTRVRSMGVRRASRTIVIADTDLEHECCCRSDSSYACPLGRSLPRVGPSSGLQMPDNLFEQSTTPRQSHSSAHQSFSAA